MDFPSAVVAVAGRIRGWLEVAASLLDVAIRLHVANVFFKSGLTKIEDWDKTLFLFEEHYRVPLLSPALAAALGTFGELVFPPLLAIGLAARFSAASLSVVNVTAVVAYWHVIGDNQAALMSHVFWGTLLLVTLLHGPGKLSLDRWIWWRLERSEKTPRGR
jgi:putative oxidoreductase